MTKYIPSDALVAEIENLLDKGKYHDEYDCAYRDGNNSALYALKEKIDTLEVKEVDLEKEIQDHIKKCLDVKFPTTDVELIKKDVAYTAKKFFELGLRSTITEKDCKLIWNIGDEIPNMPEEEFFKELLKRYKAQKGEEI